MKVAITSTGNSSDSLMDPRFGRCAFFAIYDRSTKTLDFIENPNKEASGGAGPATLNLIAEQGVQQVIAPAFGKKVKPLMEELGLQMILQDEGKTIQEIIDLIK
jgi:predicted Fe-Mo cluster-binding NifX family protein